MFQNIGFTELLLIAVVALVFFGPSKLPELGRALGKTIREFKQGTRNLLQDDSEAQPRKDVTPPPAPEAKPADPQVSAAEPRPDARRLPE